MRRAQGPTPAELRGARCRAKRVALGLGRESAAWLVGGTRPVGLLLRVEAGEAEPPLGWGVLEGRLLEALEAHVGRELAAGRTWQEIRVPGWSAAEIRAAAEAAEVLQDCASGEAA